MKFFVGAMFLNIAFIIAAAVLGTWCVNYDLLHTFHKTIPTFWAFLLNVVTSGLAIPLAIVIKILTLLGVLV